MKKTYKVAEHCFNIEAGEEFPLWSKMEECYGPFEVHNSDCDNRFTLNVSDYAVNCDQMQLVYSNMENVKDGFITFSIFNDRDNGYYFELRQPYSSETNAYLSLSSDFSKAKIKLAGKTEDKWYTFNAAVNLCYLFSTVNYGTLLFHSSAVEYQGRAYLFLGKSGTGKSTHSRMWLNALNDVVLMNDDHPIVRVWDDGNIIAYGSPWSGKTRCYKNVQAPLGGIIRIVRAPHNKAIRLSPIQSYASIMTSSTGLTWDKNFADNRDRTLQRIISHIPCWNMECLPNEEAAKVCAEAVTKVWNK